MGLNYGVREFLLPATMRLEREIGERLIRPSSYAALLRDITSSAVPLVIGGVVTALSQNIAMGLGTITACKLVMNTGVHLELNRSQPHS